MESHTALRYFQGFSNFCQVINVSYRSRIQGIMCKLEKVTKVELQLKRGVRVF